MKSLRIIVLVLLAVAVVTAPAAGREKRYLVVGPDGIPADIETLTSQAKHAETLDRAPAAIQDIAVYSFSGPAQATQADNLAEIISLELINNGTDLIPGGTFAVRFFLSDDDVFDPNDSYCGSSITIGDDLPPFVPVSINFLGRDISVGLYAPTGTLNLGVYADYPTDAQNAPDGAVIEIDETNNTGFWPITILELSKSVVYYEDFQAGPGGWTSVDLTAQELHWTRDYDPYGDIPRRVWWCGSEGGPNWVTPPGYGGHWNQWLVKSCTVNPAAPTMRYIFRHDTEPGYDFVYVEASEDGGTTWNVLQRVSGGTDAVYDGNSLDVDTDDGVADGFIEDTVDLSPYAGLWIKVRFRFDSDGAWDDEDGQYDTNGAVLIDEVELSDLGIDTFETGDDGWVPGAAAPVGGEFRLVYGPEHESDEEPVLCNTWVAYDPETGVFPSLPEPGASAVNIAIESPAITIPADLTHLILNFDVYRDLPLNNLVFFAWEIATPADGPWRNDNFVYNGVAPEWFRASFNLTSRIEPGATSIRIRLIATDMCQYWCGTYGSGQPHTPAPYFDNVELVATATTAPSIPNADYYPRPCGATAPDIDGDGVDDLVDACEFESAQFYDRDGDGCVDDVISGRHVEYWSADHLPLDYYIHENGAPEVDDGSDFTALQNAMSAWESIPGAEITVNYAGTTTQKDAQALDGVNMITFEDPDFPFPSGVLAVGVSTSFDIPTEWNGETYRPGQIADADMIFNPGEHFKTDTQGTGVDIQGVATHEAGHMFGISHSAIETATMFYVLPPDLESRSLESDDEVVARTAYPDAATMAGTRLTGTVTDGETGEPVPGVIVFAINAATEDAAACTFTMPTGGPRPGTFAFADLPAGDYYVSIYPLDGSGPIRGLEPGNINQWIYESAVVNVIPEYWNLGDGTTEDPADRTVVSLIDGIPADLQIVTNLDVTGPTIVHNYPTETTTDAGIDTPILIDFDEAVDGDSFSAETFSLRDGSGNPVYGSASLLNEDRTFLFVPDDNLAFASSYSLQMTYGITDRFGNPLQNPLDFTFSTEPEPAVAITNLAPNKGVAESVVLIGGAGFNTSPASNTVAFNATSVPVTRATETQLVVTIPSYFQPGVYEVAVRNADSPGVTSNIATFTVLEPDEVARAYETAEASTAGLPRSIEISPDGDYVFVATSDGVSAVSTGGGGQTPVTVPVNIPGGIDALDVTPDGRLVYAVSDYSSALYVINADPSSSPIGLLRSIPIPEGPRGIVVDPAGRRAYLTVSASETQPAGIQVWDIFRDSGTYERQIGFMEAADPNLTGKMTIDPAGDYLLAPSAAGVLAVFDIGGESLFTEIAVQSDPRDVLVDPQGQRAYVTDGGGIITIVGLANMQKIRDIKTGGSLRGAAMTAAGSYIYATDYQFDFLTVIDLVEDSPTYRSVESRVAQPANPIDVVFSPDGVYAYTLVEDNSRVIVTTVGIGPALTALSVRSGREDATVVLSGSGFTGYDNTTVSFNGTTAVPTELADDVIVASVPAGATSGPVRVVGTSPGVPDEVSNSLYFEVLVPSEPGAIRPAAEATQPDAPQLTGAMAVSPDGLRALVGDVDGGIHLFDNNPDNATYGTFVSTASVVSGLPIDCLTFTPDGRRAFVSPDNSPLIAVIDITADGVAFDSSPFVLGGPFSGFAVSADGHYLLGSVPGQASVQLIDITTPTYPVVATTSVADAATGLNGIVSAMAMHPAGGHAYLAVDDDSPASVVVLDMDPASATFAGKLATVALPAGSPAEVPISLALTPDGSTCYVLTSQKTGAPNRTVVRLNTSIPDAPVLDPVTHPIATTALPMDEHIRVSPNGDRAVVNIRDDGFIHFDITTSPDITVLDTRSDPLHAGPVGFDYTPDGRRLLVSSSATDVFYAFDFKQGQQIAIQSGDTQTGVVGEALAAPLTVLMTEIVSGNPTSGVPLTFEIASGGGYFATDDPSATPTTRVVETGENGFASVVWVLGPDPGAQSVTATAADASGSPLTFSATAVEDPETLPLTLATVAPFDGATDVSVTTVIHATFSRTVDVEDFPSTAFFLSGDGGATAIPVLTGFSDDNRRISLAPVNDLEYSTTYSIIVTRGVKDLSGNPLTNPVVYTFTTSARQPILLSAVSPPSAIPSTLITLSGDGFDRDPAGNLVTFTGGAVGPIVESSSDYISVRVPYGAYTGPVYVESNNTTSNAIPFTVLTPQTTTADDVIATIKVGSSTKSVTVSPDGTVAFAVAPDANTLAAIDLVNYTLIKSIPVGEMPWAVTMAPDGRNAFVANLMSGDVSIVDTDAASADFLKVSETLNVGASPIDIAATPDGDRIIVANAGSDDLSVLDNDVTSESFHSVIATIKTGSSSRSVTVDPDGGRIFVGTDDGYIVLGTLDYGVIATIKTGSTSKSVTVSPDGTLLIYLSTLGDVSVFSITPDSPKENQVVATIKSGSSTKSVTVSPDGTLLFLVQEEGDAILVYSLDVGKSVGVIGPDASLGPTELTLVDTIFVGENPEFVAFLPDGSGNFLVTRSGDDNIVVYSDAGPPPPVSISGHVYADCPAPETGLYGVGIDLYDTDTAELVGTTYTDSSGYYWADSLDAGGYALTLLTPVGYTVAAEESLLSMEPGSDTSVDFSLHCDTSPPAAEKMSFWKHQLGLALLDMQGEIDGDALCSYLDMIAAHFNSNRLNPVEVYDPPESGLCHDKLQVTKDLLNLQGQLTELAKARQQLMALLFNVASGKLRLNVVISQDGATVSKAITYIDNLIDDGDEDNDMTARKIARDINQGKTIPGGVIPLGLPDISYSPTPARFDMAQNYPNPFNPTTVIRYDIARPVHVRLTVFDVSGRHVATLVDMNRKPGVYTVTWDGTNRHGEAVATGIYFYRIEAGSFVKSRKMLLLK